MKSTRNPTAWLYFTVVSIVTIVLHLAINTKITDSLFVDISSDADSITPTPKSLQSFADQRATFGEGGAVPFPKSSSSNSDGSGTSAACLVIKDDNDILAEWVAYHYHVFNLRRLIVAVDPTSKTSPLEVLKPFNVSDGNFDLDIVIWHDEDYIPTEVRNNPASYVRAKWNSEINHLDCKLRNTPNPEWKHQNYTNDEMELIRQCFLNVRQNHFYNECSLTIKKEKKNASTWVALIDTDEYLVPNPWIAHYINNKQENQSTLKKEKLSFLSTQFQSQDLNSIYPDTPSAGSLFSLLDQFPTKSNSCVSIPRINFGGKEDTLNSDFTANAVSSSTSRTIWHHKHFETLRWKYHSDHQRRELPKGIINTARFDHFNFDKKATAVHYPHWSCDGTVWRVDNRNLHEQPFAIHHYFGSLERYLQRGDIRRTVDSYNMKNKKANEARGDENNHHNNGSERWWIKGWLDSFVETHGSEKVYTVLGKNYATIEQLSPTE